jgi:hypothetical protein
MPRSIKGHKLTAKEHRQWKHVYQNTGSGAQATGVVKKTMRKRLRKRG